MFMSQAGENVDDLFTTAKPKKAKKATKVVKKAAKKVVAKPSKVKAKKVAVTPTKKAAKTKKPKVKTYKVSGTFKIDANGIVVKQSKSINEVVVVYDNPKKPTIAVTMILNGRKVK
jgi:hypothetical protein